MSELIKKLEKLKGSLKGSQMGGQTYGQIFGTNSSGRYNHHSRCIICGTNGYNQQRTKSGNTICQSCTSKSTSGGIGISESTVHNKIDSLIAEEEEKIKQAKNKRKTTAQKAQPYIDAGLAEPFALAIARGVDDVEVMDLWEAEWWKQYPPEDILICSILDGELTEEEGRYLNDIRSDHDRLAMSCVDKTISIEWARALLDAGYMEYPEAVPQILDGGDPRIIARIRKLDVKVDLLPPTLGKKITRKNESKTQKKKTTKSGKRNPTASNITAKDLEKFLNSCDVLKLKQLSNGFCPKSWSKTKRVNGLVKMHLKIISFKDINLTKSTIIDIKSYGKALGLSNTSKWQARTKTNHLSSISSKKELWFRRLNSVLNP